MSEVNKNISDRSRQYVVQLLESVSGKNEKISSKIPDNVIAFIGLAGGCGATTVCCNIASALKELGYRVIIVDTNLMFPSIGYYYDVGDAKSQGDLVSYLGGDTSLNGSITNFDKTSLLYSDRCSILDVISKDDKAGGSLIADTLASLRALYDIVLIDANKDLVYEINNSAVYESDRVFCIMDENISCIANAEKLKSSMSSCGIDINKASLIMNKRTSVHYPQNPIDKLGMELVAVLPFDASIIESGLAGTVFYDSGVAYSKNSRVFCESIASIARKVVSSGGGEVE